ncbi:SPW repeat-containing protein [Kribbella sp. VKM Ac-2571]|uniref:SPW repeat domain-containing protein n=1 Tax=Kribbella sp. VKM Ac-2571 TaxID=2512222 RepID=UPI0010CE75D5|nr:SPW repeat protein [Kribbella sp. VKM Ac-2571]TDO58751.1 SPW repeat-containing protein [Kribbella sp. VKM Ac-2571]
MADLQSTAWTRPQDWLSLLAGGYLALSPLWVEIDSTGTWAMVIVGAAIGVMALIALAAPGAFIDEWMTALGGAVAFVAPWVFTYTDATAASWTSWIAGGVTVLASLAAVPASRKVYRHQHHMV